MSSVEEFSFRSLSACETRSQGCCELLLDVIFFSDTDKVETAPVTLEVGAGEICWTGKLGDLGSTLMIGDMGSRRNFSWSGISNFREIFNSWVDFTQLSKSCFRLGATIVVELAPATVECSETLSASKTLLGVSGPLTSGSLCLNLNPSSPISEVLELADDRALRVSKESLELYFSSLPRRALE